MLGFLRQIRGKLEMKNCYTVSGHLFGTLITNTASVLAPPHPHHYLIQFPPRNGLPHHPCGFCFPEHN